MQKICPKQISVSFSCSFIEPIIKEGAEAVDHWFLQRKKNPLQKDLTPNDFNGWSQVARRLSVASKNAMSTGDRWQALLLAKVACAIYEDILPKMKSELEAMGLGHVGVDMTKLEAIDLQIRLLNQFGPQDEPFILTVKSIEHWFFCGIQNRCINQVKSELSLGNHDANFSQLVRSRCILSHIKVLQRLNEQYLSAKLQTWLEAFQ